MTEGTAIRVAGERNTAETLEEVSSSKTTVRYEKLANTSAFLILLLGLWQLASVLIRSSVLPGPWTTFRAAISINPYQWSDMRVTSVRILGAFGVSFASSLVAGVLIESSLIGERLIEPWVTIAASIPALVFVVVVYLVVGLTNLSAMIAAVFVVAPSMTCAIWDGMEAINPEAAEMTRGFGVPRWAIIRRVVVPETIPFIFVAARNGFSLT